MTGDDLEVEAVDDLGDPDDVDDGPDMVTVSVKAGKSPFKMPGSELRECRECGEDVAISPSTIAAIERGIAPDVFSCVECATAGVGET